MVARVWLVFPFLFISCFAGTLWGSCEKCENKRDIIRCSYCKSSYERPIMPLLKRLDSILNNEKYVDNFRKLLLQDSQMGCIEKLFMNDRFYCTQALLKSLISREKVYVNKDLYRHIVSFMPMASVQGDKVIDAGGKYFFTNDELFELMNFSNQVLGVGTIHHASLALHVAYLIFINDKGSWPESRDDYVKLYALAVASLMETYLNTECFTMDENQREWAVFFERLCCSKLVSMNGRNQQVVEEEFDSVINEQDFIKEQQDRFCNALSNIKTVKISQLHWQHHVLSWEDDAEFVFVCVHAEEGCKNVYPVIMSIRNEGDKSKVFFHNGSYLEFDTEQGKEQVLPLVNNMLESISSSEKEKLIVSYEKKVKERIGIKLFDMKNVVKRVITVGTGVVAIAVLVKLFSNSR